MISKSSTACCLYPSPSIIVPSPEVKQRAFSPRSNRVWRSPDGWHSQERPREDLARAALNLVGIAMRRLRQRRQFAPQLNQIAIAIVPVVQDRKIADDLVNVSHCVQARTLVTRVGFYIESNAAQVDISAGRGGLDERPKLATSHRGSCLLP